MSRNSHLHRYHFVILIAITHMFLSSIVGRVGCCTHPPPLSDFFPLHLTSRRFLVRFLHGIGVTTCCCGISSRATSTASTARAGGMHQRRICSSVMGFLPKVFDYLFNDMGGVAAVVAHNQSVNALFWDSYQDEIISTRNNHNMLTHRLTSVSSGVPPLFR